jgi:L-ascorbate oxidase
MSCFPRIAAASVMMALSFGAYAKTYTLSVDEMRAGFNGREHVAMTVNGQIPGPALYFAEGEDVTINVTNRMDTDTSIHWHGILLPYTQDGVPGISLLETCSDTSGQSMARNIRRPNPSA